jgi:putative hydrolase of the HAD superfamily
MACPCLHLCAPRGTLYHMFKYLILDLDETLYPRSAGLMTEIGRRILLYMTTRMGFAPDEAESLKKHFFVKYGTTLRGLQLEYHVDPDDYLQFVHDVPLEDYITPDPALDAMLSRIWLDKVIFTNADAAHARRVMERLGVAHHFPNVVDIHAVEFYCKPHPQAYQRTLDVLGVPGSVCIMVEDSARNLRPARELFGMTTILVDGERADGVDYAVGGLMEVEGLVNRLMAGEGRGKPQISNAK